jgi:hypothetical protein
VMFAVCACDATGVTQQACAAANIIATIRRRFADGRASMHLISILPKS